MRSVIAIFGALLHNTLGNGVILNERSKSPSTGKTHYTHKRFRRSSLLSLAGCSPAVPVSVYKDRAKITAINTKLKN
jgi:hypothetical protein